MIYPRPNLLLLCLSLAACASGVQTDSQLSSGTVSAQSYTLQQYFKPQIQQGNEAVRVVDSSEAYENAGFHCTTSHGESSRNIDPDWSTCQAAWQANKLRKSKALRQQGEATIAIYSGISEIELYCGRPTASKEFSETAAHLAGLQLPRLDEDSRAMRKQVRRDIERGALKIDCFAAETEHGLVLSATQSSRRKPGADLPPGQVACVNPKPLVQVVPRLPPDLKGKVRFRFDIDPKGQPENIRAIFSDVSQEFIPAATTGFRKFIFRPSSKENGQPLIQLGCEYDFVLDRKLERP